MFGKWTSCSFALFSSANIQTTIIWHELCGKIRIIIFSCCGAKSKFLRCHTICFALLFLSINGVMILWSGKNTSLTSQMSVSIFQQKTQKFITFSWVNSPLPHAQRKNYIRSTHSLNRPEEIYISQLWNMQERKNDVIWRKKRKNILKGKWGLAQKKNPFILQRGKFCEDVWHFLTVTKSLIKTFIFW